MHQVKLAKSDEELLEILTHNQGFDNPCSWLNYARRKNIRKRDAVYCPECPECKNVTGRAIGQYFHFSQLVRMRKCDECGLIYSDVLLAREIVEEYYERAYKDDAYFAKQRSLIYDHIIMVIRSHFGKTFTMIDVGGAKGYLSHRIQQQLPYAKITLNDISNSACKYAGEHFSLNTICCDFVDLGNLQEKYDMMIVIDLLYYAVDISAAWSVLSQNLAPGGILVLRIPNKLWWILPWQKYRRFIFNTDMQDQIRGINPEHIRFFTRSYLRNRLLRINLSKIRFYPSPPLLSLNVYKNAMIKFFWIISLAVFYFSFKKIIITPGYLVVAKNAV